MAKKVTNKVMVATPFYKGELQKMPQEVKAEMKEKNPKDYKRFFGEDNN